MRARVPAFSPNTAASSKQTQRECLAQARLEFEIREFGRALPIMGWYAHMGSVFEEMN